MEEVIAIENYMRRIRLPFSGGIIRFSSSVRGRCGICSHCGCGATPGKSVPNITNLVESPNRIFFPQRPVWNDRNPVRSGEALRDIKVNIGIVLCPLYSLIPPGRTKVGENDSQVREGFKHPDPVLGLAIIYV